MKREFDFSSGGHADDRSAASSLAPILAGARARGMADAMAMLGLAAVFLGADGVALFANDRARALMGEHLRLAGDRLQASDAAAEAFRGLVESTRPDGRGGANSLVLRRGAERPALRLVANSVAALGDEPFQLLKAVVTIIEEQCDRDPQPQWRCSTPRNQSALSFPH